MPGTSAILAGATNAMVVQNGMGAHGRLPGSPEAAREVALALGGAGPTCVATVELATRVAVAAAVAVVERDLGTTVGPGVRVVDGRGRRDHRRARGHGGLRIGLGSGDRWPL